MKKYEWLLEEPDLNRLACDSDCDKISRPRWGYGRCDNEKLMELIARIAGDTNNLELLIFIVGNGYDINTPLGGNRVTAIARTKSYDCQRFLIDHGATTRYADLHIQTVKFIDSRNSARLGAFAVLRALRTINRNVASIVARVVWESRGMI